MRINIWIYGSIVIGTEMALEFLSNKENHYFLNIPWKFVPQVESSLQRSLLPTLAS